MAKVSLRNGLVSMRQVEVLLRNEKGVTAPWIGVNAKWRSVVVKR